MSENERIKEVEYKSLGVKKNGKKNLLTARVVRERRRVRDRQCIQ